MTSYTVTWSVSVDTEVAIEPDTPFTAALIARGMMQDTGNVATWFHVTNDDTGESVMVDSEDGAVRRLVSL